MISNEEVTIFFVKVGTIVYKNVMNKGKNKEYIKRQKASTLLQSNDQIEYPFNSQLNKSSFPTPTTKLDNRNFFQ